MFKIIQRYLAVTFIPPFFLSVIFFTCFLLTFDLFKIMNVVINKGVDLPTMLILIKDLALSFMPMAIPLSVLFAMLYTMNKMSEDSEVIAMRSFGFSKHKLFLPFLIMGIFIALSIFSLNRNIIPIAYKQFANIVIKLSSKGTVSDLKSETFFTEIPNITLFAGKVYNQGKRMDNVFIHFKSPDNQVERIIFSQKGGLVHEGEDDWGLPQLRLHLENGNITKIEKATRDVEKVIFEEYDFPLFSRDSDPGFITKDSMKTNVQLIERIATLTKVEQKKDKRKAELEYWSRINAPFQCLVFVLLGFTLGIKKARGRSSNTGVLVLIVLIVYYSLLFFCISLSKKDILLASFANFAPTLLAFIVGAYFYRKLDWVS